MKPYLLTEIPGDSTNAGFKAKNDIRLALAGAVEDLTVEERFRLDKLPTFFALLARLRRLPKGSRLIIQCPIYSFFNEKFIPTLCRTLEKRQFEITLILHDVDSLRYPDRAERLNPVERRLYSLARRLIVHNEVMKRTLQDTHGVPAEKMTVLGLFDYLLSETPVGAPAEYTGTVFVAGNLDPEKSGYIYRLGDIARSVPVNLYGSRFAAERASDSLCYRGVFPPDELPRHLEGNFGLVWDGDSTDTCAGQTGAYLQLNNPHKTSLYLAAGFPVIIWSGAALAPFITENGLGLAVDSLARLPERLDRLTRAEYAALRQAAQDFGARLRDGDFIRRALQEIL